VQRLADPPRECLAAQHRKASTLSACVNAGVGNIGQRHPSKTQASQQTSLLSV